MNKVNQQVEGYKADLTLHIKYAQSNSRIQAMHADRAMAVSMGLINEHGNVQNALAELTK